MSENACIGLVTVGDDAGKKFEELVIDILTEQSKFFKTHCTNLEGFSEHTDVETNFCGSFNALAFASWACN